MRSKASHFVGLFKFIIFLIAVILLVFVVVHWARQRQNTPQASQSKDATSITEVKDTKPDSKKTKIENDKPQTNDKPVAKKSTNSNTSQSASTSKTSGKAESHRKPIKTQASTTVPDTGLGMTQAITGAVGAIISTFLFYLHRYSRKWQQL